MNTKETKLAEAVQERFVKYYKKYREKVKKACMAKAGGSEEIAEQMTQDIFVLLLCHLEQIKSERELVSWLTRIIRKSTCVAAAQQETASTAKVEANAAAAEAMEETGDILILTKDRMMVNEMHQYICCTKTELDGDVLRYKQGGLCVEELMQKYQLSQEVIESRANKLMTDLLRRFVVQVIEN